MTKNNPLFDNQTMDPVEERKKRIEALKKKKAQLLSEGDLKKGDASTTQTYHFTFIIIYLIAFVFVIIPQKMIF